MLFVERELKKKDYKMRLRHELTDHPDTMRVQKCIYKTLNNSAEDMIRKSVFIFENKFASSKLSTHSTRFSGYLNSV